MSAAIRDVWAFIADSLLCVVVGRRGLVVHAERLVPAGLVGPAAFEMFTGEDAGLLAAEGAGAGG